MFRLALFRARRTSGETKSFLSCLLLLGLPLLLKKEAPLSLSAIGSLWTALRGRGSSSRTFWSSSSFSELVSEGLSGSLLRPLVDTNFSVLKTLFDSA